MRIVLAGLALGVLLSRFEEVTPGFSCGISSDSAWVALAFPCGSAMAGVVAMTVADAGYYAWLSASGMPLA